MRSLNIFTAVLSLTIFMATLAFPAAAENLAPQSDQKITQLLQNAENLIDANRDDDAEALLNNLFNLAPDNPELYRIWGKLYVDEKQWSKATTKLTRWAELEPNSYAPYEALGDTASRNDQFIESNRYLAKAKQLNPGRIYLTNFRCFNFVQLHAWEDALKECTEAITSAPGNEYAYSQRTHVYRALGDTLKADRDSLLSGPYHIIELRHREYQAQQSKTHHFPGILFALPLGLIALMYYISGLKILFRKKPLIVSNRYGTTLCTIACAPMILLPYLLGDLPNAPVRLMIMNWLIPIFLLGFLTWMWTQRRQGYALYGLDTDQLRQTLFATLAALNLAWQETLSNIHLPQENLDLKITLYPLTCCGEITTNPKTNNATYKSIITALTARFSSGQIPVNNRALLAQMLFGSVMLGFALIFLSGA